MNEDQKHTACGSKCPGCQIIWAAIEVVVTATGKAFQEEAHAAPMTTAETRDWRAHVIGAVIAWGVAQGVALEDGNALAVLTAFGAAMSKYGGLQQMEVRALPPPPSKPERTH